MMHGQKNIKLKQIATVQTRLQVFQNR